MTSKPTRSGRNTGSCASFGTTPDRLANLIHLLEDQPSTLDWFAEEQAYLRTHQPPTLIVWGPHDGYMPEESAQAYHRDLPEAPLHLLGGGHWLLETHLDEVVPLVADFQTRGPNWSHLGESNS
ncbi:alpha/beta fold hydrolase [Mycobacterium lehmannii]|uniref:alpha/beta fold hydrolase n=1 Tax=Mycobacterium lehmannii TaxID=2048550 RepID=UPI001F6245F5|nr:alpha/beta hydrolase [Mycobacterium lehmannii]